MKIKIIAFALIMLMVISACGRGIISQTKITEPVPAEIPERTGAFPVQFPHNLQLDDLAQFERTGSWFEGMGFAESVIRENTGDYAGAVIAVYKELSWAYSRGLIPKNELEQALLNILAAKDEEPVIAAANAVLAFSKEQWAQAAAGLEPFINEQEEPDSFGRWMILVCILEENREDRRAAAAYQSIRARYTQFPEYWYRGARVFSGFAAAEYAENCVNVSSTGPFAQECRSKLAVFSGLGYEDGLSIKTKTEIETIISSSLKNGNPHLLDPLLPLIGLPENPYTVYAVGALRALNSIQIYHDYFYAQAASSNGRLAERLSYIGRS